MPRFTRNYTKKIGLPAGALIHLGEQKVEEPELSVISYNEAEVRQAMPKSFGEVEQYRKPEMVLWLNIDGLHDTVLIDAAGKAFGIHPLVLEDILHVGQRPKIDEFETFVFIVLRMLSYDDACERVVEEQVSLVLGDGFVLSFQEKPGDVFAAVRERILKGQTRIRRQKADYLAYALMDAVIDNYFHVLDRIEQKMERLDEELFSDSSMETFQRIGAMKKELILLRKSTWPLREIVGSITKSEFDVIDEKTLVYFRDVHDHIIHAIDILETFRDMASSMHDTYMNYVNNRMNEIMKVLTVIATIFIPLTFIAGIYGMNFQYMPELSWRWGYFGVLGMMLVLFAAMLVYFRRKKWF